jgi:hypothetical protein
MKSMLRRSVDLLGDLAVDLLDSLAISRLRRSVDLFPYGGRWDRPRPGRDLGLAELF